MKKLSREDILKANQPKTKEIEVPEWNGAITIKSLKAGDVLKLEELKQNGKPTPEYFFALIAYSVVDENLKPVLTIEQASEIESIPLNRILIEILDLNKMAPDAVQKAREDFLKMISEGSPSD